MFIGGGTFLNNGGTSGHRDVGIGTRIYEPVMSDVDTHNPDMKDGQ